MGRTTQYIGLHKEAEKLTEGLACLPPDTYATGLVGEPIPLGRWRGWESRGISCLREVVQEDPWCSGPMIFTCLELDYGKGARAHCAEWVHDPLMEGGAYDRETGRMAVMSLEGETAVVDNFISTLTDCKAKKWADAPTEPYRLCMLPLWVRREVYGFGVPGSHKGAVNRAAEIILCVLALERSEGGSEVGDELREVLLEGIGGVGGQADA